MYLKNLKRGENAKGEKECHYPKLHVQCFQLPNHITRFQIPFAKGLIVYFVQTQVHRRAGKQPCFAPLKLSFVPFLLTCSLIPLIWLISPKSPRLDTSELPLTASLPLPPCPLVCQVLSIPPLLCLGFHLPPTPFPRYIFSSASVNTLLIDVLPSLFLFSHQDSIPCTQRIRLSVSRYPSIMYPQI